MNDDQLSSLFAKSDEISVDENAKKRAINLALAEFSEVQQAQKNKVNFFQGILSFLRPTSHQQTNDGRDQMKPENKKIVFGGFAGAAVSVFAWVVFVGSPKTVITNESDLATGVVTEEVIREERQIEEKRELVEGGVDEAAEEIGEKIAKAPISAAEKPADSKGSNIKKAPAQRSEMLVDRELGDRQSREKEAVPLTSNLEMAQPLAKRKLQAPEGLSDVSSFSADARTLSLAPESRVIPMPKPVDVVVPPGYAEQGRDVFEAVKENDIKLASEQPVSTFSADVDTASYSFVRSSLQRGVLPQKNAVRIEEMVNYFDYAYPVPKSKEQPFKPTVTVVDSPWAEGKKLMHIGIKGYELDKTTARKTNLIFLLDVSGSMNAPDKLPLVKQSMSMLLNSLNAEDKVGIVVYAGAAGTVLEPTSVSDKQKILNAMNRLQAGGSTAGGEGIKLAYKLAEANFSESAVNRIILATDGDFNVGIRNREELQSFIERKREKGIFLSVLGFGRGNYNDHLMQVLAQNGNGVAAYIDTLGEAQKILVNEASSTLFPIAKDVKFQFEFNPAMVAEYRLIGYETRVLQREDFNNDKVGAGDIGAGHTVTAIYEFTPQGSSQGFVDERRYGNKSQASGKADEYGFLKIRYKLPQATQSQLITHAVPTASQFNKLSKILQRDINFASAVVGFAQLLKTSKYVGDWNYDKAIALAQANKGEDEFGYRTEFVQLIRKAKVAEAM